MATVDVAAATSNHDAQGSVECGLPAIRHGGHDDACSSSQNEKSNPALTRVGARGVRLKAFEEVVADLLPNVIPSFVHLPPLPSSWGDNEVMMKNDEWPFVLLPPSARVSGSLRGQLSGKRAQRKEGQLRSLLRCVIAMLPLEMHTENNKVTIVDFCGGTGHLALPLALLLPHCDVIVVDLKAASLQYVHEKVLQISPQHDSDEQEDKKETNLVYEVATDATKHDHVKRQCHGVPNLYTFHGSIESYKEDFDVGLALHACGEATDIVLRRCGAARASFVVSPCCVGKLNRKRMNPYVYHATAANAPTISYPQSCTFSNLLTSSQWDALAKAADYSEMAEFRTPRNAARRTAKALLETDRLLFMQQRYGYQACLTRMDPWEASPKNDILMGWFDSDDSNKIVGSPYRHSVCQPCHDCNADVQLAMQHLLEESKSAVRGCGGDSVDWTWQEEEEIRQELREFMKIGEQRRIFPTGMGGRRRKLVHYVAEQMDLAHWCQGKKDSEKTVVIAKRTAKNPI